MYLRRNKENNIFSLEFNAANDHYNVQSMVHFGLYNLLYELNKDVMEKLEIVNQTSANEIDVLYVFKKFNSDIPMKRKYMYLNTVHQVSADGTEIVFTSKSIPYPMHDSMVRADYELISTPLSILKFNAVTPHMLQVAHMFKMNVDDDLPVYMENMLGVVMKKMFYKLKVFIENMK